MLKLLRRHVKALSIMLITLIVGFSILRTPNAHADSNSSYYSHLSQSEIEDIFELKVDDVSNPWTWISQAKTFAIAEDSNGHLTYWWNTPNLQMNAQNSLYGIISMSGFGSGAGKLPNGDEWLVDLGDADLANTALKKYGFSIPTPTYVGERPLITISIAGVLLPDGILNTAARIGSAIFSGTVVGLPTDSDMNSLLYISPRDYETSGITFERWVDDNWYDALDIIQSGQVLLSTANQSTGMASDGKYWVRENIIDENGLNQRGLTGEYICQKLEEITGDKYPDVAKNIILTSGLSKNHQTERIMPYDLSRMNAKDASMFNGISDPRSEIQQSAFSTGYDNLMFGIFKSLALSMSGKMAEITIALNGFTNFTFLENIGFSPVDLWNNSIIQILILIMLSAFIFYTVKSAMQILTGRGSYFYIFIKAFCSFIVVIITFNVGYNSQNTYNLIKNVSSRVFNLTNVVFESNDEISALYGTGDAADRENVTLWLPYFNMWTSYMTNHSITDASQNINLGSNEPEVQNMRVPTIDGVDQTLWSTILADTFSTPVNYSGNIYRVVDHFMAPRIRNFSYEGESFNISVSKNENYTGNIQSSIDLSTIPFQFLILAFTILKVALFFEFNFNIAMLLFNLALSVTNRAKLSLILKELGASMLNVSIMNAIIGLVVWSSIVTYGFGALLICIFYIFLSYNVIKELAKSNSVFTPKFFRPVQRSYFSVKRMFSEGV